MPSREIRYIGSAWQVTSLPDGTKEVAFNDPDGVTVHVLPLPQEMAEALAAQLRGEQQDRQLVAGPRRDPAAPGPAPARGP